MRIPRWLIIPFILVGILYWSQDLWESNSKPTLFDLPKTLEDDVLSLEVYPVSNVNNVAVFTTGRGGNEDDRLYLTPASDTVSLPENFHALRDSGYIMKVHGRFFQGHGIPAEYFNVTPKPERLRVFQFDSIEMIAPQNKA